MPRSDLDRLRDIREAIEKIERYTAEHPRWAEEELGAIWDAILYNFAIIGEAAKAISSETKSLVPDADWSPAARTRDVVIHRYPSTDPAIVVGTVDRDLPALKKAVEELINRLTV